MLDTCTHDNRRDFGARYLDTYGWLVTGDKKLFIHICDIDENHVHFDTGTELRYNARIGAGVVFEFIPIDRGYFRTITNSVYLLWRNPARQWKRGISHSNTHAVNVNSQYTENVNYKLLSEIFNSDKPRYSERWERGVACAMSKHFAISAAGDLMFYRERIGSVSDNIITLANEMVRTEINDVISRNGLNLKVKE